MKYCSIYLSIALALAACGNAEIPATTGPYAFLEGHTMGTTYHITFENAGKLDLQADVDSVLAAVNMDVSTYIDSSYISRFNQSAAGVALDGKHPHFEVNLKKALEVAEMSGGYFDPTVMPLVNYWGFGYTEKKLSGKADTAMVDSLMQFTGYRFVNATAGQLVKTRPEVQLDFSALAKGYGVDAVGWYLEAKGVDNYLVEIGGEVRARGHNAEGETWRIGINTPAEDALMTDFQAIVRLENMSMATSGNYRNFYEVSGAKYSHTINPLTGFPERNTLLSASVFASDCMTADALATACMAMGPIKAMDLIKGLEGVEAYFITGKEDGSMTVEQTPGVEKLLMKK